MREDVELSDGRVLLRPYRPADVDGLYEAAYESIDDMFPWMAWCHPGYAIEETRQWAEMALDAWREDRGYEFVMTDAGDGSVFGGCGLNRINNTDRVANLGYWVRSSRTRRGVASAATRLLARFGFEQVGLNRIEIIAAVDNTASQRVAEKAGATREGVLRNRLLLHERVHDAVMFSLVPDDLDVER